MTTQPTLFGPADTTTRQGTLFPTGGRVSELSCCECGAALEHTPGGYLACPGGCGRLAEAVIAPDAESGLWFGDETDTGAP